MFCNKCGTVVPDDSAFCHKCGYKFVIPLVQTPTPTQTTTPQPVIYPPAAPQGAPQQPIAPAPVPQPVAVPQPQVAPQRVQYAPKPAPQPQVITPPQTIPQPTPVQLQYQQPTYQPQPTMQYASPVGYTLRKVFEPKKSAAIVSLFALIGPIVGLIIYLIIGVIVIQLLLYPTENISYIFKENYVLSQFLKTLPTWISLFSLAFGFFIFYRIFFRNHKDKAPPLTWAFSFVVFEMLFNVFNTFMLADKEPDTISSLFYGLGSLFFATVIGYLATAGFLIQSYSRFDDNGNIIPEKLLRKDGRALEKNSIIICSLSAPITVIVSLLFNLIFEALPTLSGFFTISVEYAVCVLVSFASLSLFTPKKSFSEFPLSLRLIGASATFIPLPTYFLEDYAIIPDIIIKSTIAFVIMYFILKSFATPAKEFQEEQVTEEIPAIIE